MKTFKTQQEINQLHKDGGALHVKYENEIEENMNMDRVIEICEIEGYEFISYEGVKFTTAGNFARCLCFNQEHGTFTTEVSLHIDGVMQE